MRIVKQLTKRNFSDKNDPKRIKYIVLHYFGSLGTAAAVADVFERSERPASAHYIVDEGDTVYQSVEDGDIAWHCGTAGKYKHAECRNSNSIGIEMRPRKRSTKTLLATDRDWYFDEDTIENTITLVKLLMLKYNVPLKNVVRHFDVMGKICPAPFVHDTKAWDRFKIALVDDKSFSVRITADSLNVRTGPGVDFAVIKALSDKGVYSIEETSGDWGRLKGQIGWINLAYTLKV